MDKEATTAWKILNANSFVGEKKKKIKNFHQAETLLQLEALEATTASKWPQSSNFTSDLEFVAQIAYATMFVWAV